MSQPTHPTAADLERLIPLWFADARLLSARDRAEVDAWRRAHGQLMLSGCGPASGFGSGDAGPDCSAE